MCINTISLVLLKFHICKTVQRCHPWVFMKSLAIYFVYFPARIDVAVFIFISQWSGRYGSACSVMSNYLWPMDYGPSGPSIHGIFQVRILEWVAISYSRGSSWTRYQTWVFSDSCIGRMILYQLCHPGGYLILILPQIVIPPSPQDLWDAIKK